MTARPPSVLFICKGNWFRSQMAAAIYNKLAGADLAQSVGTYVGAADEPEGQVLAGLFSTPAFFEFMEARGMDVRRHRTRRLDPNMLMAYDVVVSMAEEPFVPTFLKQTDRVVRWDVANPPVVDEMAVRATYEKIEALVLRLLPQAS
jgi:protein-tyrosine-phosphatase